MNRKVPFYILVITVFSTLFSCLDSSDTVEVIYSPDAEITSFKIGIRRNDIDSTRVDSIYFSIDQINSQIFNKDSAGYGFVFTEKAVLKFTTASGYAIINVTGGDSVLVTTGDSIDFTNPILFRSYAATGGTKTYLAKFNIHQIDPDSMQWKQVSEENSFLNGEQMKTVIIDDSFYCFNKVSIPSASGYNTKIVLYKSSDMAVTWHDVPAVNLPYDTDLSQLQVYNENLYVCTSSGELYTTTSASVTSWTKISSEYPVKKVFGVIDQTNKLVVAVEKEGLRSAVWNGASWVYGNLLSSNFPSVFSSLSYTRANTHHLTIVGEDVSSVWGTIDGIYWSMLSATGSLPSGITGSAAFLYNEKFYMLNGYIPDNGYNEYVYSSRDEANTWVMEESKTYITSNDYRFRTNASVVVDSNNFIYIIGGNHDDIQLTDIWKGRLNKLIK